MLFKLLTIGSYDPVNLTEELGDDEFYTDLLRRAANISRQEVLSTNVLKLVDRYNGMTFDADRALNRDLDSERQVLEEAGKAN